jgi:hypothetical protein
MGGIVKIGRARTVDELPSTPLTVFGETLKPLAILHHQRAEIWDNERAAG